MGLTRFSKFFCRGLDKASERAFFASSIILILLYCGALGFFRIKDVPIEKSFFAQRDAVRIAHALANPLPVNQLVAVSKGGVISPDVAILAGWSVPEASGIWSIDRQATAVVAVPRTTAASIDLVMYLHVMLDRQGQQTLDLYGNDKLLGRWTFTNGNAELRIPLSMDSAASRNLLKLEFVIGEPTKALGRGDQRTLGIYFDAIGIEYDK